MFIVTDVCRASHRIELAFIKGMNYLMVCTTKHNATFGAQLCTELKLGHFGKCIRNTSKVLKCGAGEEWRRSVGPIV
jgi:hypothetical protein